MQGIAAVASEEAEPDPAACQSAVGKLCEAVWVRSAAPLRESLDSRGEAEHTDHFEHVRDSDLISQGSVVELGFQSIVR